MQSNVILKNYVLTKSVNYDGIALKKVLLKMEGEETQKQLALFG